MQGGFHLSFLAYLDLRREALFLCMTLLFAALSNTLCRFTSDSFSVSTKDLRATFILFFQKRLCCFFLSEPLWAFFAFMVFVIFLLITSQRMIT